MRQGSTQTIEMMCNIGDITLADIDRACFTISKNQNVPLITIHDFKRFTFELQEDKRLKTTIKLTENETLNLPVGTMMMQLKFGLLTGDVLVSNVLDIEVESGLCKQPMFGNEV